MLKESLKFYYFVFIKIGFKISLITSILIFLDKVTDLLSAVSEIRTTVEGQKISQQMMNDLADFPPPAPPVCLFVLIFLCMSKDHILYSVVEYTLKNKN